MSLADKSNKVDQRAQPAGVPAPDGTRGAAGSSSLEQRLLGLHARLCELEGDAGARCALVGVPASVDAAWSAGRMLPVLRAKGKSIETAVERLERSASASA